MMIRLPTVAAVTVWCGLALVQHLRLLVSHASLS
jgi:hypothetical protein